jgi:hypothetical protein
VSISRKIHGEIGSSIDIHSFIEKKNEIDSERKGEFESLYRATLNNSKGSHKFSKSHELRILGAGQFLGLQDSLLKRSKNTKNYFSDS